MGRQVISCLDTNVVVFLHSGIAQRLTQRAVEQIESTDLLVSAMACSNWKCSTRKARSLVRHLRSSRISVCPLPMAIVVNSAMTIKWTRESGDLRYGNAMRLATTRSPGAPGIWPGAASCLGYRGSSIRELAGPFSASRFLPAFKVRAVLARPAHPGRTQPRPPQPARRELF